MGFLLINTNGVIRSVITQLVDAVRCRGTSTAGFGRTKMFLPFIQVPNVNKDAGELAAHYKCTPCDVTWVGMSKCWVCEEEGKFLNRIVVSNG